MITIVDYGSGNISAITNIYQILDIPFSIASKPYELEDAVKIILPGVGSFDYCMNKLNKSGLKEILNRKVLIDKVPVLGICIGMHLMADHSDEGTMPGLSWIKGRVIKFDNNIILHRPKVPHMGWNSINGLIDHPILNGINDKLGFYFVHSYFFECNNSQNELAKTFYGHEFSSAIISDNIFGVQFHPEKSHSNGLELLKNFSKI
jgi:imidazole glycerol-phosphate synthase subunit HisH